MGEGNMKYCSNCKRHIASTNFVMHEVHCRRNIMLCEKCQEPVARSELESHNKEEHAMIPCDMCHVPFEHRFLDSHTGECPKRPCQCPYCEIECPRDGLDNHMTFCGTRTELCLICSQYIMKKDLVKHEESNCTYPEPKHEPQRTVIASRRRSSDSSSSFVKREMERIRRPPGTAADRESGSEASGPSHIDRPRSSLRRNAQREVARQQNLKKIPNNEIERENMRAPPRRGATRRGRGSRTVTTASDRTAEAEPVMIPCENCGESYPINMLLQHQTNCTDRGEESHVASAGPSERALRGRFTHDDDHSRPTLNNSSLFSSGSSNGDYPTGMIDNLNLPNNGNYPAGMIDNLNIPMENDRVTRSGVGSSSHDQDVLFPCEFCCDTFPEDLLIQHQSICDRNPFKTPRVMTPKVANLDRARRNIGGVFASGGAAAGPSRVRNKPGTSSQVAPKSNRQTVSKTPEMRRQEAEKKKNRVLDDFMRNPSYTPVSVPSPGSRNPGPNLNGGNGVPNRQARKPRSVRTTAYDASVLDSRGPSLRTTASSSTSNSSGSRVTRPRRAQSDAQ